jgi:hypothetical protein
MYHKRCKLLVQALAAVSLIDSTCFSFFLISVIAPFLFIFLSGYFLSFFFIPFSQVLFIFLHDSGISFSCSRGFLVTFIAVVPLSPHSFSILKSDLNMGIHC